MGHLTAGFTGRIVRGGQRVRAQGAALGLLYAKSPGAMYKSCGDTRALPNTDVQRQRSVKRWPPVPARAHEDVTRRVAHVAADGAYAISWLFTIAKGDKSTRHARAAMMCRASQARRKRHRVAGTGMMPRSGSLAGKLPMPSTAKLMLPVPCFHAGNVGICLNNRRCHRPNNASASREDVEALSYVPYRADGRYHHVFAMKIEERARRHPRSADVEQQCCSAPAASSLIHGLVLLCALRASRSSRLAERKQNCASRSTLLNNRVRRDVTCRTASAHGRSPRRDDGICPCRLEVGTTGPERAGKWKWGAGAPIMHAGSTHYAHAAHRALQLRRTPEPPNRTEPNQNLQRHV
nr:unnamed protein product [Digitaria exilis]